jgi:hypothetical protein
MSFLSFLIRVAGLANTTANSIPSHSKVGYSMHYRLHAAILLFYGYLSNLSMGMGKP